MGSLFQFAVYLNKGGSHCAGAKGEVASRHGQSDDPQSAINWNWESNIDKDERQADDDTRHALGQKRHGGEIACKRA